VEQREREAAAQERERESLLGSVKALEVELAAATEREAEGRAAAAVEGEEREAQVLRAGATVRGMKRDLGERVFALHEKSHGIETSVAEVELELAKLSMSVSSAHVTQVAELERQVLAAYAEAQIQDEKMALAARSLESERARSSAQEEALRVQVGALECAAQSANREVAALKHRNQEVLAEMETLRAEMEAVRRQMAVAESERAKAQNDARALSSVQVQLERAAAAAAVAAAELEAEREAARVCEMERAAEWEKAAAERVSLDEALVECRAALEASHVARDEASLQVEARAVAMQAALVSLVTDGAAVLAGMVEAERRGAESWGQWAARRNASIAALMEDIPEIAHLLQRAIEDVGLELGQALAVAERTAAGEAAVRDERDALRSSYEQKAAALQADSEAAEVRARELRLELEAQLKCKEDECRVLRERDADAKARRDEQTAREVEAEMAREQERASAKERERESEREREQEREVHGARVGEMQAQVCELEVELRKVKEQLAKQVQSRTELARGREAEARQAQHELLEAARNLEIAQNDIASLTLALYAERERAVQMEEMRDQGTVALAAEAREREEIVRAIGGDARPKQGIEAKAAAVDAEGAATRIGAGASTKQQIEIKPFLAREGAGGAGSGGGSEEVVGARLLLEAGVDLSHGLRGMCAELSDILAAIEAETLEAQEDLEAVADEMDRVLLDHAEIARSRDAALERVRDLEREQEYARSSKPPRADFSREPDGSSAGGKHGSSGGSRGRDGGGLERASALADAALKARVSAQAVRAEAQESFQRWHDGLQAQGMRASEGRGEVKATADDDFAEALSSLHTLQAGSPGHTSAAAAPTDVGDVLEAGKPAKSWMTPPALPPWTGARAIDLEHGGAARGGAAASSSRGGAAVRPSCASPFAG